MTALIAAAACLAIAVPQEAAPERMPNVVLVYTDDLGYGDLGCYGAERVPTPHCDRIAREGLRFTDAHCSAATCTPSRYALLTGEYAFRRKARILRGDAPLLIDVDRTTLADLFASKGYRTSVVGKWHLGLGDGSVDWNTEVAPGPRALGFHESFLVPATGDRTPCVYVENGRVVGLDPDDPIEVSYGQRIDPSPSGKEAREGLKQDWSHGHNQTIVNGISRIGWMIGGESARWVDEDMADVLVERAVDFIDRSREQPFFLYFSTHDIHVPRVPHSRFVGQSKMGPRGDAIVQMDFCVGALLAALDERGLAENTLFLFSSDNGPVLDDGYADRANEDLGDHRAAGPLRAGKYSAFEGGTRVPLLVRWPGRVEAGAVSGALFGQVDLARSLAGLIGAEVPEGECPDSRDHLAALLGADTTGRPHLVHEAGGLSLRVGQWKLIPHVRTRDGLGPWTRAQFGEAGALFDLSEDLGETRNVIAAEPERAAEMHSLLERIRQGPDR